MYKASVQNSIKEKNILDSITSTNLLEKQTVCFFGPGLIYFFQQEKFTITLPQKAGFLNLSRGISPRINLMIVNKSVATLSNKIDKAVWQSFVNGYAVITIICDDDIPMTQVIAENPSIDEVVDYIAKQFPDEFVSVDCVGASSFETIAEFLAVDEQVTHFVLNHPTTTFYDVFVTSVFAWNHANQSGVIH